MSKLPHLYAQYCCLFSEVHLKGQAGNTKDPRLIFPPSDCCRHGCDPSDLVKIRHFLSKQTTTRHPDHWIYSINIPYFTKSEAQIIVSVIYLPIVVVMMASSLIRLELYCHQRYIYDESQLTRISVYPILAFFKQQITVKCRLLRTGTG